MDILNRNAAPFGTQVWTKIDTEFQDLLSKRVKLRSIFDFNTTKTFDDDSIATGRTKKLSKFKTSSVYTREPIKIVEVKHTFILDNAVLDELKRGIEDFDNSTMQEAANAFASVENSLILDGLKEANIEGILSAFADSKIKATDAKDILTQCAKSLETFDNNFIDGPFKLVLSYNTLSKLVVESIGGISIKEKLTQLLGADALIVTNAIGDDKALMVSQRGGDFEFYSSVDISLGFEGAKANGAELFLFESCALKIITPEAGILIEL